MSVLATPMTTLHPERRAARNMTAEDLWEMPRVGAPRPSPDGKAVIVPVTRWDLAKNEAKTQLHLVPTDGSATSRALTSPDLSAGEPRYSPDSRQLAFTRKDASGKPQLMVMPIDGGEARKLTDLPLGVFDPMWLPDGSGIVFGSMLIKGHFTPETTKTELERRAKDPVKAHVTEERFYRYWDTWLTTGEVPHLFVYEFNTGAARDLMPASELWFEFMDPSGQYDIAPDGSEIVFCGHLFDSSKSLLVSHLFTLPLTGGEPALLTSMSRGSESAPRYTSDGKYVIYGRTYDPEFYADRTRLARYDRAAKTHGDWLEDWDLSPVAWFPLASGSVAIEAEQDGRTRLFAWHGAGEPTAVTSDGTVGALTVTSEGRAHFTWQTLSAAAEVYTCGADGAGFTRLTRFTDEASCRFACGEVRDMRFTGARGEIVQMFVILPPGFDSTKKYPLVHVIHGGPHGISGDLFHARWNGQLFAAPGYVVAMVNFQGSTSWGQDFAQRIQGEWAARPFEDVMLATDHLIAQGYIDDKRMAAAGGSYGGYMAAWIAGHTDRFRCIVDHAGVHDLTGQYASDVTQGRGKASGGEAWDGLERQDAWSPIRFASGMNTPMLVLHGERDYRVPVGHGLLLYGVLKAKGVPARLVYFPDENHWVLKAQNSLLWYREVHGWLGRWLEA